MTPRAPSDPPRTPAAAQHHLGEVVSVDDPDDLARVQVRLYGYDGIGAQDAAMWARVAVPFAGRDRGAFLLPDVGDEVLVAFVAGDPRQPVVVGGLWNGDARPRETLGGAGDRVDRWTLVGKAGTRIAIVEESSGQEKIELSTPGGVKATITDEGGGKIRLEASGSTVTLEANGVTIETGTRVNVSAAQVSVTAGTVQVDSAMASFSGIVRCATLQASAVISSSYTPGAGNVW
ncbi:phage baseplate assembly protein V [Sorangium sp. So ce1128]